MDIDRGRVTQDWEIAQGFLGCVRKILNGEIRKTK
jgi:hypothetical protein